MEAHERRVLEDPAHLTLSPEQRHRISTVIQKHRKRLENVAAAEIDSARFNTVVKLFVPASLWPLIQDREVTAQQVKLLPKMIGAAFGIVQRHVLLGRGNASGTLASGSLSIHCRSCSDRRTCTTWHALSRSAAHCWRGT